MVRDQVRNRDRDLGGRRCCSARLSRWDEDGVSGSAFQVCHEWVDVCWYGTLAGSLFLQAAFGKDGFGPLVGCYGLPGLDLSFFLVHAVLFFEVELVIVFKVLHFFLLLDELKLFRHRVHGVDVGDGAMEVSVVISRVG
jgi:hypothetical protein